MNNYKIIRKILRATLPPFVRKNIFTYSGAKTILDISSTNISAEEANNSIYQLLIRKEPCMIARLGNTEINTLIKFDNFIKMNSIEKIYQWAKTSQYPFSSNCILNYIYPESGFYPVNKKSLTLFREELTTAMKDLDILGSWIKGENNFIKYMKQTIAIDLQHLEPYYHPSPWTRALKDKNVLVIHPFTKSIEQQYKYNREKLFSDKQVLPKFNLKLIKSPFTTPGENKEYQDWFTTLESIYEKAKLIDFDIAILGCGSYGFPLASKIKKIGKKSVHLGGATQLLFGVKGRRWKDNQFFKNTFNEFWIYPSEEEIPLQYQKMDNGCYWK